MPSVRAAERSTARPQSRRARQLPLILLLAASAATAACGESGAAGNAVLPRQPGDTTTTGSGGAIVVPAQPIDAFGSDVVAAINAERTRLGIDTLKVNQKLVAAAQLQGDQMKQTGVFDNTIPGTTYPSLTDRVNATGYAWGSLAESIARGTNASAVVQSWLGVPADRTNLVDATYTEIGVAEAITTTNVQYVVAVLAKPKP